MKISLKRVGNSTGIILPKELLAKLGLQEGDIAEVFNTRGRVLLDIRLYEGVRRGVVIAESIFPNAAHREGRGINMLTGSDPAAPYGGAAFHDNRVAIRRV